jgi:serine/threonine-protein kinase
VQATIKVAQMNEWWVPGFTELGELGAGAQGRVVLARHDESGTLVAIKYLAAALAADPRFVELFRDEARMLARVADPHVARLHEFVTTERGSAIVMEAVNGTSLRELLKRHGTLGPEAALVVLKGSLRGLAAAHAVGVVHRDYKPANVLVQGDGGSKLVDFGVAVRAGEAGVRAGTPSYMAPEQWRGEAATPATDVYAATCVFFECVTGRRPYRADDRMALMGQHVTGPVPLAEVPEPLRPLVERGLAKEPQRRPPGAGAFVTELEAVAVAAYGPHWEHRGVRGLAVGAAALAALFPLTMLMTAPGGAGAGAAVLGMAGHSTGRATVLKGLLGSTAGKVTLAVAGTALVVTAGGAGVQALKTDRPAPSRTRPVAAAAPINVKIDSVDQSTSRRQYVTISGHRDAAVQQRINAALRAPVDREIAAYVKQFGGNGDIPTGTATIGLQTARLLSVSYDFAIEPKDTATGNWVKNFTSTRSVTVDLTSGDTLGARQLLRPAALTGTGVATLADRIVAADRSGGCVTGEGGFSPRLTLTVGQVASANEARRTVELLLRPAAVQFTLSLDTAKYSQACRVAIVTVPSGRLADLLDPAVFAQVRTARPTATPSATPSTTLEVTPS